MLDSLHLCETTSIIIIALEHQRRLCTFSVMHDPAPSSLRTTNALPVLAATEYAYTGQASVAGEAAVLMCPVFLQITRPSGGSNITFP